MIGAGLAVRAFLGRIPKWAWLTLAVVIALGGAAWLHQRHANAQIDAAYAAGKAASDKEWQTKFDLMEVAAQDWKRQYEEASNQLSNERKQRHEEELRLNAELADALRLSGPGRASAARCRPVNNSGLPVGASGDVTSPPDPDAPGPEVPPGDRDAIVPWAWLVKRAEEHDDLLSEVTTWRSWHPEQAEILRRRKLELPKPTFGLEE